MQPDVGSLCVQIQELQVRRKFCIGLMTKQTNAAGGLARRALGFRWDDGEEERMQVAARAAKIVGAAFAGKAQNAENKEVAELLSADLSVVIAALAPLEARRGEIEKAMEKLARQLPAYSFVRSVRGFGDKAFAVLVGEAGDLSLYPKIGKLWKRLGLAPYESKAYSTWRNEKRRNAPPLSAEEWVAAGYSPRRRAEIHSCIGDPMSKHQLTSAEKSGTKYGHPKGVYGEIYVKRRQETDISHPDWSKDHSRNDALRIMTKAVVADLWSQWREAMGLRTDEDRPGSGVNQGSPFDSHQGRSSQHSARKSQSESMIGSTI